jgi:hypothetical protein
MDGGGNGIKGAIAMSRDHIKLGPTVIFDSGEVSILRIPYRVIICHHDLWIEIRVIKFIFGGMAGFKITHDAIKA